MCVAGVSGGRTSDEKVPRAWVVLSEAGKRRGVAEVKKELEKWHQESLSKYKWLRGGIEVVEEVRLFSFVLFFLTFLVWLDPQVTDGKSAQEGLAGEV